MGFLNLSLPFSRKKKDAERYKWSPNIDSLQGMPGGEWAASSSSSGYQGHNDHTSEAPPRYSAEEHTSSKYVQAGYEGWLQQKDQQQQEAMKGTPENHLLTLGRYDTILLVDDSRSMQVHWKQVSEAFSNLASVAGSYDKDGIDVYFVGSTVSGHGLKTPKEIERVFQSVKADGQYTPLGLGLFEILDAYLDQIKDVSKAELARIKPINIIVITDGIPSDDPASHIAQIARRLDRGNFPIDQIGIQFVQFGNDPKATEFLKELDDGMQALRNKESLRDIVDTTPYALTRGNLDPNTLMKILLGGVNKRLDQLSNTTVRGGH